MRIDAAGVRDALDDFMDAMEEIGFDGVKTDFQGQGDDPRSPHLLGCVRNCSSKAALEEILQYMARLRPLIDQLRGTDEYATADRYFKRTIDNLKRCVRSK